MTHSPDFSDLYGKVCLITGGTGVLGRSLCEALAAAGVKTAIFGRDAEKAISLAEYLTQIHGTSCMGVSGDVLNRLSIQAALEKVRDQMGPIDLLINGAGGNAPEATTRLEQLLSNDEKEMEGSFFALDTEAFDQVLDLNLKGTLLPSIIVGREMAHAKRGVILNISSMSAFRPLTKIPAYSAAKASVNSLTQWMAVHLAKAGIRVNAIAPGFFLTTQNQFLLQDEKSGQPTPRGKKIIDNTPMGRYGVPDDLHGAALFLLSDLSAFVTGVVLPVDGGYNAFGGV